MSSRPSRGAARLAAILDALPDALVLVNANGTVINANAIALEAFEAPGTALVGRGLLDLLPEFDSRLIPGSMRRPDTTDERGRTKPKRMIARRTDGTEFPVEVTSSNLEDSRHAYDERYGHGGYSSYSGDEMLMIVVRDLSGALNTEAELARSQRQTEMILRAAAEGVVGTDTDGRVVLVNPAAAQILGFRASDLGGQELHPLVLHSRADGEPFPYEESPLADTLRSGRKHRVRNQVLWTKSGEKVAVDLTTAPVRDGDQLVGAVMTFTDRRPYDALAEKYEAAVARHAEELREAAERREEELAAEQERYAALAEREKDRHEELAEREQERYDALAARHRQLVAVLDRSLRGPLDELRRELAALAADDAGQLWPEANQVLHHLSAGYARMTTLVDDVLGFQRLEAGEEALSRAAAPLDAVVAAGVDGAVELIGPGRIQFAVHAPPIEVHVDARRLATALAHLIADVAGIDATGNTRADAVASRPEAASGYVDSTVVVAAAQRGEVVRIEVRGPYDGGDPVHGPVVRGIVRAHGGVLQTHEVPGTNGSAYVLEVPIGEGSGGPATTAEASTETPGPAAGGLVPEQASAPGGGRRRARRSSVDSFLDSGVPGAAEADDTEGTGVPSPAQETAAGAPRTAGTGGSAGTGTESGPGGTGRRRRRAVAHGPVEAEPAPLADAATGTSGGTSGGTGRRRGRPSPAEGAVMTAAEHAAGSAALGETVPPQGVPSPGMPSQGEPVPSGRRARRVGEPQALAALPSGTGAAPEVSGGPVAGHGEGAEAPRPGGRRARRALAAARERAAAEEASNSRVFALPPAEADREAGSEAQGGAEQVGGTPVDDAQGAAGQGGVGRGGAVPGAHVPGAPGARVPGAPGAGGQPVGAQPVRAQQAQQAQQTQQTRAAQGRGVAPQAGPAQAGPAQGGGTPVGAAPGAGVPGGVPGGMPGAMPAGTGGTPGGMPSGTPGATPGAGALPGRMPQGATHGAQGGSPQLGAAQGTVPRGNAGQGGAPQAGAPQGGAAQPMPAQAGPVQAGPVQAGPAQVGASVSVPAGVQAGLRAGVRTEVPAQGGAHAAAPGGMPVTAPGGIPVQQDDTGQHALAAHDPTNDHTPPQPHPAQAMGLPAQAQPQAASGRRRARQAPP
ncbi:PAS domain-containing protein, partial [Streptomyces longispororuber]|uniref:PAS domain-containing protein n=1 Tax=Streptomyces longispororuber TaxID=68230 RepID=UPI00167CDF34